MAHKRKGQLTVSLEWAKHLRKFLRRQFWKGEQQAERLMEQQRLSNNDLAGILGYKSRVTDLFNGHRKLNLGMIRKLHDRLHISLETLIRNY